MKRMKIVELDGYAANPGDLSWQPMRELAELVLYDRSKPSEVVERVGNAEMVLTNKVVPEIYRRARHRL